jgi:hypothetical protein
VLFGPTLALRLVGLLRIPLLFVMRPRVLRLDDTGCDVVLPLSFVSRNHVGSMYFAALAAGADCAAGLLAVRSSQGALTIGALLRPPRVVPIFKSLSASFHKLADGDVMFSCNEAQAVDEATERTLASGARVTLPVQVIATVPSRYGKEPVATFVLELSMKKRRS